MKNESLSKERYKKIQVEILEPKNKIPEILKSNKWV